MSQRRGFALLVVLAAIVVAGTTLSTFATTSLERGLSAQAAQAELQQRWGVVSCERTLLPRADGIFKRLDEQRKLGVSSIATPGSLREQIVLGGQTFDLILADEGAKADLNAIYHSGETRLVEESVQQLVGPIARQVMRFTPQAESAAVVRRRVARQADDEDGEEPIVQPAFRTWGDVFDMSRLRLATGDDRMLAMITQNITLWGNGRLNVDRSSDDAVTAVAKTLISDGLAKRIVDRYREYPEANISLLLEREVKNPEDRTGLQRLLGQGSTSYSLWTESTSRHIRRQKFSVLTADENGRMKTFEFAL